MTSERIALWDNARFLAIVLVVLGHGLTKMVPQTPEAFVLYVSIYLFHIPLFVFLSGYFAKADAPTSERIRGTLVDLVLPYVILEIIWSMIHSVQAGEFLFNPLRPSWTLWFLLSLATWRILLPYIAELPAPLLVSVVIAALSGYWSVDQTLSISRTLAFLPFFVVGWQVRQTTLADKWLSLSSSSVWLVRAGAIVVFGATAIIVQVPQPLWRDIGLRTFLTADKSYLEVGLDQWWAGGVRLGLFAIAILLVAAFLALVPRRNLWITQLGAGTMTVYVLHSFILAPLRETGVLAGQASAPELVLVVIGSVVLSVLLAHPITTKLFAPLTKPNWVLGSQQKPS